MCRGGNRGRGPDADVSENGIGSCGTRIDWDDGVSRWSGCYGGVVAWDDAVCFRRLQDRGTIIQTLIPSEDQGDDCVDCSANGSLISLGDSKRTG
jgi:hypothetical protein